MIDYTELMICDCINKGLHDSNVQLDLLGDTDHSKTLESTLKFVEAKESGKRSVAQLLDSQLHNAAAASNSYQRNLNNSRKDGCKGQPKSKDKTEECFYCGKTGHDQRLPARVGKQECPAFGHKYTICSKLNQYNRVCQQKDRINTQAPGITPDEHEDAVFDSLCTATATNPSHRKPLTLDHHITDYLSDIWTRQPLQSQPYIRLRVGIDPSDYERFGLKISTQTTHVTAPCLADTGCQSCLADVRFLDHLGITLQDLIPVSLKMHAANNKGIRILGAAISRFSGKYQDKNNTTVETRQITYSSDKIFLSREPCSSLKMITTKFPMIGNTMSDSVNAASVYPLPDCDCPRRQLPTP